MIRRLSNRRYRLDLSPNCQNKNRKEIYGRQHQNIILLHLQNSFDLTRKFLSTSHDEPADQRFFSIKCEEHFSVYVTNHQIVFLLFLSTKLTRCFNLSIDIWDSTSMCVLLSCTKCFNLLENRKFRY